MAIIEQGTCKIEFLNNKGIGIGRTNLGIVELPYTLPGELIEFERHKYRGQTSFIMKNIIEPSPARSQPICKYFGACGGCALQQLNENDYLKFKTNLIKELLDKDGINTNLKSIILIPFGNRRRANLKVIKKEDDIYLGFHRFHSHQIINIDECPAILGNLSALIIPLKDLCYKILNDRQKCEIFVSHASNGIHILFISQKSITLTDSQLQELQKFAQGNNVIKIDLETEGRRKTVYIREEPYIKFGNQKVKAAADSFLQASTLSDEILKNLVLEFFLNKRVENSSDIIDLFCGRGTFTLPLAQYFNVTGYESDNLALASLNETINHNCLPIKLENRDLFGKPVLKSDLNKYSYAVINPPRPGARAQVVELAQSDIKKIAYISCNTESFIEDTKILIKGGYNLLEITPVDQFPYTAHLELVAAFQKQK